MVSRVGTYALIMLVLTLLFDLTFIKQILSETGVKVKVSLVLLLYQFLRLICFYDRRNKDVVSLPMKIPADVVHVLAHEFLGSS